MSSSEGRGRDLCVTNEEVERERRGKSLRVLRHYGTSCAHCETRVREFERAYANRWRTTRVRGYDEIREVYDYAYNESENDSERLRTNLSGGRSCRT